MDVRAIKSLAILVFAAVWMLPQMLSAEPTVPPYAPQVTFNISGNVLDRPEGTTVKNTIKQKISKYWRHGACPAPESEVCTPSQSCGSRQVCAPGYHEWASCPEDAGPVSGADGEEGACYCWDAGTESCQYDTECSSDHEMCVDGQCRDAHFDWRTCDKLRYGLTVFDEPKCQADDATTHRLVDEQEEGDDVEDAVDNLTKGRRPYCRDQSWRPTDDALLEFQREDKFPGGASADEDLQERWWERPHVNSLYVAELPQSSDDNPDGRTKESILNTCRLLEGRHDSGEAGAVPPIITYVLLGPNPEPEEMRYGGLLAAAGGTGRCCWNEDWPLSGCPADSDYVIDACQHIRQEDRSEHQIREDLTLGHYSCEYRADAQLNIGSMNWDQKTDVDCHLTGETGRTKRACDNYQTALAGATDILGEMTCLKSVPRGKTFDEMEYLLCQDGEKDADCERLTRDDIRFMDPGEHVFLITDRESCELIQIGDRRVVRDPCPNAGLKCSTGKKGRCAVGRLRCVDNEEKCVQLYEPMPEICNGLDDDCDGSYDNIKSSWPEFNYTPADLPDGYEEVECNQKNFCVCPDGQTDSHVGETFEEYARGWGGACYCSGT